MLPKDGVAIPSTVDELEQFSGCLSVVVLI